MQICELGEQGLLRRLQTFCPPEVVGDDAALVAVATDHQLVVTTDVLVDGVHFSWGLATPGVRTTTPYDAGWRAAAANLSDIAAMGATPLGVTVGLSAPPHLEVADLDAFYNGLRDCLQHFDTPILGGDVCRSSILTVAIAALGEVFPQHVVQRSTAKPGDAILVTGYHGASRAGLELLLGGNATATMPARDRQWLIQTHQRPIPRLDVVTHIKALHQERSLPLSPPAQESLHPLSVSTMQHSVQSTIRLAGMDSSDGLADAVLQLCRASGVGAILDRSAIPIPSALSAWQPPQKSMEWALYGGEDFELVLCCEEAIAQQLCQAIGPPAAIIGSITVPSKVVLSDPLGVFDDEILQFEQGFQHFHS